MIIEDGFDVDAPVERVWALLKDIPRVAGCMPGATITEVIDSRTYRAHLTMKVGPMNVGYDAMIVVDSLDDTTHRAEFSIKGDEARGRGGVSSQMTSEVTPVNGKAHVVVRADTKISGIVATFGGRLIEGVAKKQIATFAKNLSGLL